MDTITLCQSVYVLEDCEDAWNESPVDGDITASVETTIYQRGSGSAKFVFASSASANDKATEIITSTGTTLNSLDTVCLWMRSTVTTAAGDLHLLLDDTAACASPLETLSIPALTANTWKRVILTLANASSDTNIISIGIRMTVDIGAFTLYIDDVIACKSKSFSILAIKGFTKSHARSAWPNTVTPLLDGTLDRKVSRYGRKVTVGLYPVTTEADVTWLMDALTLNASVRIISSDTLEEMEGVHQLSNTEMEWANGFEFSPTLTIPFEEKTPIWSTTRKPPSWA